MRLRETHKPSPWKRLSWRPVWRRPAWLGWWPGWAGVQRLPISLMLTCLLVGLGTVQLTFLIGKGLYHTYAWHQETAAVRVEIAGLQRDLRVLREVQAHADDPQELQAQARCLGFVGRAETVVVAQDAPDGASNNCDAVRMP